MRGVGLDRGRDVVSAAVERGVVPGAVALVRHRSDVVLREAFGAAALHPDRRPMTVDTVFDLASLTKPLVGAGVAMALVDRGVFSLDEEVTGYVPELAGMRGRGVTWRRLLAHTAGITGWRPVYASATGGPDVLRAIDTFGLASTPGSRFEYSDLGYIVLGLALERAAGAPLATTAAELVLEPCGLTRTGFLPVHRPDEYAVTEDGNTFERRMADWAGIEFDGWRTTFHPGEVNDGNAHYGLGGVSAHAGLFSCADDVATMGEMWLRSGAHGQRQVLSAAAVELATADQLPGEPRRGLGWDLFKLAAPPVEELRRVDAGYFPPAASPFVPRSSGELFTPAAFGHTGFTGTSMWIDPVLELVVVLLTNATHPTVDVNRPVNSLRARFANAVVAELSGVR
jgi:CubicO group peptidase (beta-lactamase class C family)